MDIKSKTTKEEKNKERILINLKKKTETLKNLKEIIKNVTLKITDQLSQYPKSLSTLLTP